VSRVGRESVEFMSATYVIGHQRTHSIVDVPEAANANLHDQENEDRDERSHQGRCIDRHDLVAKRIGEVRIDDLTVTEGDGERAGRCRRSVVDLNK